VEYIVTNSGELAQALKSVTGGDTILLKGDEPFEINNQVGIKPESNVTITSFDPEQPATIATLLISKAENLTFDGLIFDSSSISDTRPTWLKDINVSASSNITIQNSDMRSTADGPLTLDGEVARAASLGSITGSDGFSFVNNSVSNYNFGLLVLESTNTVIADSEFTQLQGDAIRLGGVQGVTIEGNYIHDPFGSDSEINHMDMIQIWSTRTTLVTQDVTITGNVLDAGDGAGTQSIFIRNERADTAEGDASDLFYKNITITDNVIYNGHLHGITVGETDGVIVANNTLALNPEAVMLSATNPGRLTSPSISVAGDSINVQITDNVAYQVKGPDDAVIEGNYLVDYSTQNAENYVGNVFVAADNGGSVGLQGLAFDPNGPLGDTTVGSSFSQFVDAPEALTAMFKFETVDGAEDHYRFDASLTADSNGPLADEDAVFEWTFADGTKAYGQVIEHIFDNAGPQDVTLQVIAGNGAVADSFERSFFVKDTVLLDVDVIDGNVVDGSFYNSTLTSKAVVTEDGLHVSSGHALRVDPSNDQIYNLEQFSISFGMKRDSADGGHGDLAMIHKSFKLVLNKDGELDFTLTNSEGTQYKVVTEGANLTDTDWHRVTLSYDGIGGNFVIFVDGKQAAEIDVEGQTIPLESWGLTFGSEWYGSYTGLIDKIEMTADPTDQSNAYSDAQEFFTYKEAGLSESFLRFAAAGVEAAGELGDFGPAMTIESYDAGGQDHGDVAILEDGAGVVLEGNAWKTFNLTGEIGPDTVLRFDFSANMKGEIQAISLTSDGVVTEQNTFQILGTQTFGLQDFKTTYSEAVGTVTLEIPVGQFLSGSFDQVVLIADDDANSGAVTTFSNFTLTNSFSSDTIGFPDSIEAGSEHLSDYLISLENYWRFGQDEGLADIRDDGRTIELTNNAWKFIDKRVTIDEDSHLDFFLDSDDVGEVQAIGFLKDGKLDDKGIFQLGGNQSFGIQDYNGLRGLEDGPTAYSLDVGKYLQGAYDGIVLIADDDGDASGQVIFSDLEFFA